MWCDALLCDAMWVLWEERQGQERVVRVEGASKQGGRVGGRLHSAQVQVDLRLS